MIILSWNVNGLRSVLRRGFLDWFSAASPDVLCLQETRLTRGDVPPELRLIEGYLSHFSFAGRGGYSGVVMYARAEPVSVEFTFGAPEFDDEGRHIIADFGDFVLANVYFPNGRMSAERLRYKLAYYDAFLNFADEMKAKGRHLIVCGDFNTAHKEIDLARPKANERASGFLPEERSWLDSLVKHGFIDTFRMFNKSPGQYTWWSQRTRARDRNVGWRLDYFFVDRGLGGQVKRSWILADILGSDHCPVGLEIETPILEQ